MSNNSLKPLNTMSAVVTKGFIRRCYERFPQDLVLILLKYVDILALPVIFINGNTKLTESVGMKNSIDVVVAEPADVCCLVGPINSMISDSIGVNISLKMPVQYWDCGRLKILVSPDDNISNTIKGHSQINRVRAIEYNFANYRKEIESWDRFCTRYTKTHRVNDSYSTQQDDIELRVVVKKINDKEAMYRYGSFGPWTMISVSKGIYVAAKSTKYKEGFRNQFYTLSIADVGANLTLFSCKDI